MLEMSWITAILQFYSQVADLYGNIIVKRINIRLFDLLARFHYILNLSRIYSVSTKIYDKRDDFDFDIVNFPFLDGDLPRRPSYVVYVSLLIRFAGASSHVNDFNYLHKFLTAKLL